MSNKSEQSQESANIQEQIPYQLNESGLDTHHSEDSEFQEMANRKIEELEKKLEDLIQEQERKNEEYEKIIEEQGKRIEALKRKNEEQEKNNNQEREEYEKTIQHLLKEIQNLRNIIDNERGQPRMLGQQEPQYSENILQDYGSSIPIEPLRSVSKREEKRENRENQDQIRRGQKKKAEMFQQIQFFTSEILKQSDPHSNRDKILLKITLLSAFLRDGNPRNGSNYACVQKQRGQLAKTQYFSMRDGRSFQSASVIYLSRMSDPIEIKILNRNLGVNRELGRCWMRWDEILQMSRQNFENIKPILRNGMDIGTLAFTAETVKYH